MIVTIEKKVFKDAYAVKLVANDGAKIVGRAFLYVLYNDLHAEPFALLEDVFVDEAYRSKGIGRKLVEAAMAAAKEEKCYKIICTSRHGKEELHKWYEGFGFKNHGVEFRLDF